MKDQVMHTFGKTPDIFTQRVEQTLLRLEERPMKKPIRKPAIIAIAAIITMIGIAAAAGSTILFDVFNKQPIDGAEDSILEVASESIKVNDDITAAVDKVYYDGTEILYEMTLMLTDPEKYALIDFSAMNEEYAPPTDITHIVIAPQLFDSFEEHEFLDIDQYYEGSFIYRDEVILEEIGSGIYKLYGNFFIHLNENMPAMRSEMDLDLNLCLRYAPKDFESLHNRKSVAALIPVHVTKTTASQKYTLTPVALPDGWTLHSAELELSPVGSTARLYYTVAGVPAEIHDEEAMWRVANRPTDFGYTFTLVDTDDPASMLECHNSWSVDRVNTDLRYESDITFCALDYIPERLTFEVSTEDKIAGQWVDVTVATIEFIVTETE